MENSELVPLVSQARAGKVDYRDFDQVANAGGYVTDTMQVTVQPDVVARTLGYCEAPSVAVIHEFWEPYLGGSE